MSAGSDQIAATTPKIKACVVLPGHWSAVMGGAQYQTQCIVDAMIADGRFEVHYLARSIADDHLPDGYELHRVHTAFGQRKGYLFLDAPSLLRLLEKIRPDVIYQRTGSSYTGVTAWYAKRHRCRMIWHAASQADVSRDQLNGVGAFRLWQWADKKLLEYGIRNVGRIVTQTADQKAELQRSYGRKAAAVIRNFHPLPERQIAKPDRVRVIWLANLKRVKRPELFIDLARDLMDKTDADFTIVGALQGAPAWRQRLLARIEQTSNIEYLGALSQDAVNDLLAVSHILVNTSMSEGFSNTFIQAWMRHMPVVSLTVNPDDVFGDQKVGVCAGTYAQLVETTLALIEDSRRRCVMGDEAAAYAKRHHSQANVRQLLELMLP
jgi:glycosyltransferase involved in cell wall biosynthesis